MVVKPTQSPWDAFLRNLPIFGPCFAPPLPPPPEGITGLVSSAVKTVFSGFCNGISMGLDIVSAVTKTAQVTAAVGGSVIAGILTYDSYVEFMGINSPLHKHPCKDLKGQFSTFFNLYVNFDPSQCSNKTLLEQTTRLQNVQVFLIPVTIVATVVTSYALGQVAKMLKRWNQQFFR